MGGIDGGFFFNITLRLITRNRLLLEKLQGALCNRITHRRECKFTSLHSKTAEFKTGMAVEKNLIIVSIIIDYRYLIQEITQKNNLFYSSSLFWHKLKRVPT